MKKRPLLSLSELLRELQRRRVYSSVAAYAVVAWVLLQVGEVTFGPLGIPDWVMTGMVVVIIFGFPVVLTLAWIFDVTPQGLRREAKAIVSGNESDDLPSIAVLPFVDMSPDNDQGYFCDGVAEEILNALTKTQQLHVTARMSSFQYRGSEIDIRRIGKKLGVGAILEGSVRKSGDHLRVTAQLINVSDGYHLWSKSFDQDLKDIFAIQDEIATSIAKSLLDTFTSIKTTSSRDVLAYEYYLRGRQFFNRFNKRDIEFALQMFRQAIDVDPEFALAWAGYADCHSFMIMYVDNKGTSCEEACNASKRALELGPELAEAHASCGLTHLICDEFASAEEEFKTALELNPNLFEANYYYGRTRFHQGDVEMAADLFEKAAAVNPADYQSRCLRAQILRGMGRTKEAADEAKEAVAVLEKHLEWHPDDTRAMHLGAGSLILVGDIDRAKRWMHRALEIDPDAAVALYNVACNYATLGEVDQALNYLEQAAENGVVSVAWMKNDEDLANLRGHPRFEEIQKAIESQSYLGAEVT